MPEFSVRLGRSIFCGMHRSAHSKRVRQARLPPSWFLPGPRCITMQIQKHTRWLQLPCVTLLSTVAKSTFTKGSFEKRVTENKARNRRKSICLFFFFNQYFIYIICIRKILGYNDKRIRIYLCRESTSAMPDVMRN